MIRATFAFLTAFVFLASPVLAHTGVGSVSGVSAGFGHPIAGVDHVLAMIAVGLLAARLGGWSLWFVPAAFVAMMAVGGVLGVAGATVPFVEQGIIGSVIILGAVLAVGRWMPVAVAVSMVGTLAVFHGYAHGAEMPVNAGGLSYGIGFVAATALLHIVGLGLGVGVRKVGPSLAPLVVRASGGAIAAAGVALATI